MGTFSGMAAATRGYTRNPLEEGDYVVRIEGCQNFEAKQTGEKFKIELTVLAVNGGANKEGEVRTVIYSKQHGLEQFLANVKSFIAGVMNVPDAAVGEAEVFRTCEKYLSEGKEVAGENAMRGLVCRVRADSRASKKKNERGENYSYFVYTWYPCMDKAEIEQVLGAERVRRHFPSGL